MNRIKRKTLAIILSVMVAMTYTSFGYAEDVQPSEDTAPAAETVEQTETQPATEPSQVSELESGGDETAPEDSTSDITDFAPEQPAEKSPAKDDKSGGHSTYIEIDNSTSLEDGTYKASDISWSGGMGHITLTCDKVIIIGGKANAVIRFSSQYYTHVFTGKVDDFNTDEFNEDLYDGSKMGQGVYTTKKNGNSAYAKIPVSIGSDMKLCGRTTAMTEPHWVNYTVKIIVTAEDRTGDAEEDTDDPDDPDDPDEPDDPTPPVTGKLGPGTWKVKATTDRQMFYLYPKEKDPAWVVLKIKKNGTMKATIILNGQGYDYVYMGTPDQARSAGKSNWIKGKKINGYYSFTIPVSKLDKKLAITPHSWKYETDTDPMTDPWRPNKWILIYSKNAKKVKDGYKIIPGSGGGSGSDSGKTDDKPDSESKWKDDKDKSTHAVDNSTSLKDGVYVPDKFRWSGGSGRLAYIKCTKVTVKNGEAFGTIVFASTKYDSLKANGRVYSRQGGGNSTFVIPVKLNANNTIIGRTTAMSQPHWVQYKIFIYIAGATKGKGADGSEDGLVNTKKLPAKAPELIGLENTGKIDVEYSKYFKIFTYEQDITLVCVDQASDTALYKKPKKSGKKDAEKDAGDEEKIEYDDEGKPIAKTENETRNELYQNNIVNYLVVPEGVDLPAGIEKDCIIIQKPVESVYVPSDETAELISAIGADSDIEGKDEFGEYDDPDFNKIVLSETGLAVLPAEALPEKTTKKSSDEDIELSDEKTKKLNRLHMRYASLAVPLLVDRSAEETTNYGQTEWVKVYGSIFGAESAADEWFSKYVKDNKRVKIEHE